jgi:hypothetical protein
MYQFWILSLSFHPDLSVLVTSLPQLHLILFKLSPNLIPWSYSFFQRRNSPQWARASSLSRLHDHTQTHTTLGRTPLDKRSARPRDLYLTTHNTHKNQAFMTPAGFEPIIPASERQQTDSLDGAATGIGMILLQLIIFLYVISSIVYNIIIVLTASVSHCVRTQTNNICEILFC